MEELLPEKDGKLQPILSAFNEKATTKGTLNCVITNIEHEYKNYTSALVGEEQIAGVQDKG